MRDFLEVCHVVKPGVVTRDDERLKELFFLHRPNSTISSVLGFLAGRAIPAEVVLKLVTIFPKVMKCSRQNGLLMELDRLGKAACDSRNILQMNMQWLTGPGEVGHEW